MRRVNTDVAYDFLRDKILSGHLGPGEALMTEELAERIGVSRTPVRDALRRLESDGLVTIVSRLGAHVTEMDEKEFTELCEVRLALESYAAGQAAENRTRREMGVIQAAFEQFEQLTEQLLEDPFRISVRERLVKADVLFHMAIIEASRNSLISREVERLNLIRQVVQGRSGSFAAIIETEIGRQRDASHLRGVQVSHEAVLSAIQSQDVLVARSAMEEHIQDVISRKGVAHPEDFMSRHFSDNSLEDKSD